MTVRHSVGLRTYALDNGIGTAFDGGTGRLNVYSGAQPATADTAASGTLLGTLTLSSDAFGAASAGAIAFNTVIGDTSADASGTAGWVRIYRTGDTVPTSTASATDRRLDLAIGSDITIDNANIVAGGTINLSSFTYQHST